MKKILIISHAMELGGAERSLLGLLDALDCNQYQVDLFLLRQQGELLDYIPHQVNLLPEIPAYTVPARPMTQTLREGHLLLTGARLVGKLVAEGYGRRHRYSDSVVPIEYSHKYTCPFMPPIQQGVEYDLAISFLTPHYYVLNKVRAKQKIGWIHTDYSKVQVNRTSELAMWGGLDRIISISPGVTDSFLKTFPELHKKIVLIENILPEGLIRTQAEEMATEMTEECKLLSVGRFSHAKNFDNVPEICARLVAEGLPLKWYLIGYGGDEALIRQRIQAHHMEDHVIILGKRDNPYPYMKACDLYVQPSRYEGKCVAVREAQMLGKPVVITNYATAASQLEDGVDGVVVPMDNDGCAAGIAALLRDPARMQQLQEHCRNRDYSNREEINKLYELMI